MTDVWEYYGRDLQSELDKVRSQLARLRNLNDDLVVRLNYRATYESENNPELAEGLRRAAEALQAVDNER